MPSRNDAKILNSGASPRGWHRLQQAAECLQKYAWAYKDISRKPLAMSAHPALAKGSLVHLALAQHYARMREAQKGGDVDDWCEPEEAVELIAKVEKVEQHIDVVLRTYRSYVDYYSEDARNLKIVMVEELVSTTMGGKYLLTGRLDLAWEDLSGRIFVVDHKSTGRITASHAQFYAVSGQLLGYSHMARQLYGERYAGFIINLVQIQAKSSDRPRFERIDLPRSPNMEARFERTVIDIEESIERMEASGRAYDDWPKAMNEMSCIGRYGNCSYINQCRHGAGASAGGNWAWDSKA